MLTHSATPRLRAILRAQEAALIVGPTGSGKTYAIPSLATELGFTPEQVALVQVSSETTRYDLIGYRSSTGVAIPGLLSPILHAGTGLIVLDELDKGSPNTLLVLKGIFAGRLATSEGYCSIDRSKLFLIATANTTGSGATLDYNAAMKQDAALLNEFITLRWNYDGLLEEALVKELYTNLWSRAEHTIYRLDAQWLESEAAMFADRFTDALDALRHAAHKIGDSAIFATRQIRQAMNLMFKENLMFSQVMLMTSLRDADDLAMQTYQPELDRADRVLLKIDLKEAEATKKREEEEAQANAKTSPPAKPQPDQKPKPPQSKPDSDSSSSDGTLSDIF